MGLRENSNTLPKTINFLPEIGIQDIVFPEVYPEQHPAQRYKNTSKIVSQLARWNFQHRIKE